MQWHVVKIVESKRENGSYKGTHSHIPIILFPITLFKHFYQFEKKETLNVETLINCNIPFFIFSLLL